MLEAKVAAVNTPAAAFLKSKAVAFFDSFAYAEGTRGEKGRVNDRHSILSQGKCRCFTVFRLVEGSSCQFSLTYEGHRPQHRG
jgi:hypothetical protein